MTLAGFTAVLNMDRIQISGGWLDTAVPFEAGLIALQGHLVALKRGGETRKFTRAQRHVVSVTLRFERDLPQPFIGVIQLLNERSESAEDKNRANVEVTLPVSMLSPIAALQGRPIIFDTVHDERAEPGVDHIFADVRRVYFDLAVDEPPFPTARRSWWWW